MRFAQSEPASHLSDLLLALFTYWSLYSASAEYSTRFNADGLDHRIFYMLLAISIFVMDVNWTGDILASGNAAARCMHLSCLAGCYLLIGIMHARVALCLRSCRKFAVYHMLLNAASVGFYLVAARSSEEHCEVLCWLGCALFLLRTYGIPIDQNINHFTKQRHAQDYINRAQSVMITTLALVVKCVVKGVKPGEIHLQNCDLLLLSLVLVLLIKLLMFDVHIADTKWHAVRCVSSWRPTFFLSLVPVAMAGVMMMAAGCFLILDLEFQDYDRRSAKRFDQKAGRNFSCGFGLMLVAVTIMRLLHNRPELPSVPASRSRRITRMWQVQVVVQLVLAVISFNHSSDTTGRDGLYRSVKLTAFLVLLNLLDEMEELGHYSGNWKVVRTVCLMDGITRYMTHSEEESSSARSASSSDPGTRESSQGSNTKKVQMQADCAWSNSEVMPLAAV